MYLYILCLILLIKNHTIWIEHYDFMQSISVVWLCTMKHIKERRSKKNLLEHRKNFLNIEKKKNRKQWFHCTLS